VANPAVGNYMEITMETIKNLREQSGAGIVDCKTALAEAGGDLTAAMEILRKKGIAKAGKRAERETSQGVIKAWISPDQHRGHLVELRAETDFVARNEQFQGLADSILQLLVEQQPASLDDLLSLSLGNQTVREAVDNLSGVIGEKIVLSNCATITSQGTVASYLHAGGSIGVLVAISRAESGDLAKDIAMQIAANDPRYLTPDQVPMAEIDKEKEIYREQLSQEGKPAEMIEKILDGKVNRYFTEVCLVKQEFIKDEKQTIEQLLGGAAIEKYYRFKL